MVNKLCRRSVLGARCRRRGFYFHTIECKRVRYFVRRHSQHRFSWNEFSHCNKKTRFIPCQKPQQKPEVPIVHQQDDDQKDAKYKKLVAQFRWATCLAYPGSAPSIKLSKATKSWYSITLHWAKQKQIYICITKREVYSVLNAASTAIAEAQIATKVRKCTRPACHLFVNLQPTRTCEVQCFSSHVPTHTFSVTYIRPNKRPW